MHRLLFAVLLSAFAWSSAHASPCLVGPWRFTYGEHTSATITAPAGAICGMYIGSLRPGTVVQSVSISSPPRNGTAVAYGMGVSYQAKPDFTGQDSFTFAVAGPRNTGTVGVAITVTAPARGALAKPMRAPEPGPIGLLEYTPSLTAIRGPDTAVGAFYFIRGLVSNDRDDERHRPPQYFLASLSQAGWDVTYARYPQDLIYPGQATHGRVAEFVRARMKQLKREGYRRVIVGGQSWGAWVTLVAERQGDLPADGLFLLVPATHGKKTTLSGTPNPSYAKNRSEFAPLVTAIRKPVAAIFFADDDYDPGGRGKLIEQHVRNRRLAHLLIDNPAGFKGHGAGWLPMFDYAYGKCIKTFLETLSTQPCEPPALANDDFRAILHKDQVVEPGAKQIRTPEELVGRRYVIYSPPSAATEVTYASAQSLQRQSVRGRVDESYEFKDGQHCHEKRCQLLIRWDDKHVVGFDRGTGAALSWWIEQ